MFDVLNFIVGSTSTLLSAIAIYLYIVLWKRDKTDGSYDVFDAFYKDILVLGIDNPELRNQEITKDYKVHFEGNDRVKYESYAFLTINFCETLFDRGNTKLMHTWQDVIFVEYSIHKTWFGQSENKLKYKPEFIDFLEKMTTEKSSRY